MTAKYQKEFGQRLKRLRTLRKLSQEELAHRASLHPTGISLLERGKTAVRLDTIEELARALHVQPSKLLPNITLGVRRG